VSEKITFKADVQCDCCAGMGKIYISTQGGPLVAEAYPCPKCTGKGFQKFETTYTAFVPPKETSKDVQ
jgi:DnaJ-class molecular chaperone